LNKCKDHEARGVRNESLVSKIKKKDGEAQAPLGASGTRGPLEGEEDWVKTLKRETLFHCHHHKGDVRGKGGKSHETGGKWEKKKEGRRDFKKGNPGGRAKGGGGPRSPSAAQTCRPLVKARKKKKGGGQKRRNHSLPAVV